jgi:hypothetical protein
VKTGTIKWMRFDGDGYVEDSKGVSYLFDSSTAKLFKSTLIKGMPVLFYTENVLGREVCMRIEEIAGDTK